MEWIVWTILGAAIFWVILSIKIVGPKEMAVKVFFGKPLSVCDSGFRFVPFLPGLKVFLEIFPKKLYNLDYPAREVISKAGNHYGAQVLKIDSVAYLRFPRPPKGRKGLIEVLKSQVPVDHDELKDWTEESVVGALRAALGGMTWREAIENIGRVTSETESIFKHEDGVLIKAGFLAEDLKLTIKEIKLPPKLESALPKVDEARIEAEAAPYEAEQRAEETVGAVIQMMAKTTGRAASTIRKEIYHDAAVKKEFTLFCQDLIHRRMAIDGSSYLDIRVNGTQGPEKALLNLISAWRRIPQGRPKASSGEVSSESAEERERIVEEAIKKMQREE